MGERGPRMHPDTARAFEEIDAAVFSGDTFHTEEHFKTLLFYVGRWTRALPDCLDFVLAPREEDDDD